jgi:hypothetical protein
VTVTHILVLYFPNYALLVTLHILVLLATTTTPAGAPAPTPPASRTARSATPTSAAAAAASAPFAWWRTHKGKVHVDCLVEQLRLVGTVNGGACLGERRVLD